MTEASDRRIVRLMKLEFVRRFARNEREAIDTHPAEGRRVLEDAAQIIVAELIRTLP